MDHEFQLQDGTILLVRPIQPSDKELLTRGFEQLSPASRYRRFFHQVDHLSDAQLSYLTEVDGIDHSAFVAVLRDDPDVGVGVARWIRLPEEPEVAEGAVTVVDRYHGQGVGRTLLYLMARDAISKGIRAFRAWIVGENTPMLKILLGLGAKPGRWELGTMEIDVPLPDTVEELDETAAPSILREVASGRIEGTLHPDRPHATALSPNPDQPISP
jgi:GNAT superfamily N-acetyltransferase